MRNAVGEIDRAVDRIHHPATVRLDIAQHAFFSKDRNARIGRSQRLFDQLLTAHVQLELDVVLGGGIDSFGRAEILAHQFTDGPCRLDRAILRLVELFERIHRADGNICRLPGSVQTWKLRRHDHPALSVHNPHLAVSDSIDHSRPAQGITSCRSASSRSSSFRLCSSSFSRAARINPSKSTASMSRDTQT